MSSSQSIHRFGLFVKRTVHFFDIMTKWNMHLLWLLFFALRSSWFNMRARKWIFIDIFFLIKLHTDYSFFRKTYLNITVELHKFYYEYHWNTSSVALFHFGHCDSNWMHIKTNQSITGTALQNILLKFNAMSFNISQEFGKFV